eukprot:CAMPEP_0114154844 /NCGR_PEP_ID=MMETSP0043_2-20121206/25136_1 /TAXON_ID=464988 /ORGANISM="Hemiselmis andersenii, Strain CCMP644" /LENGTH=65 /DNA_ID=CAMNT_0001250035 /DNA_START=486 /DNA_END=683 /DNA_ORIENTATION=+
MFVSDDAQHHVLEAGRVSLLVAIHPRPRANARNLGHPVYDPWLNSYNLVAALCQPCAYLHKAVCG